MTTFASVTLNQLPSVQLQVQQYAAGIDVGCENCSLSVLRPDKAVVIKPIEFTNNSQGYTFLLSLNSKAWV